MIQPYYNICKLENTAWSKSQIDIESRQEILSNSDIVIINNTPNAKYQISFTQVTSLPDFAKPIFYFCKTLKKKKSNSAPFQDFPYLLEPCLNIILLLSCACVYLCYRHWHLPFLQPYHRQWVRVVFPWLC